MLMRNYQKSSKMHVWHLDIRSNTTSVCLNAVVSQIMAQMFISLCNIVSVCILCIYKHINRFGVDPVLKLLIQSDMRASHVEGNLCIYTFNLVGWEGNQ